MTPMPNPSRRAVTAGLLGLPLAGCVVVGPPGAQGPAARHAALVIAADAAAGQVVDQAALDPYSFIREGYLQRRRNQVYDGNPPEEDYTESP